MSNKAAYTMSPQISFPGWGVAAIRKLHVLEQNEKVQ